MIIAGQWSILPVSEFQFWLTRKFSPLGNKPSHAFHKNREGGWQHCVCRVCMNQVTEFSYVTLISTWINVFTSWCCVVWQRSDVAKRKNGVWEVVAKNKGRYQKFSFLGEMHCQSVMVRTFAIAKILLLGVSLSHKYGLNGEKHVLHIHSGLSYCSVPTIASNCLDNNTHSSLIWLHDLLPSSNVYIVCWCTMAALFAHGMG